MQNTGEFEVRLAVEADLPQIVAFLSIPVVDQSFVPPLSSRRTGVADRVQNKFKHGFWLIALCGSDIVGCRGCNGEDSRHVVEFSTLAVAPEFSGRGLGCLLMRRSVQVASTLYTPSMMKFDSWVTNEAVRKIALRIGFTPTRVYDDPEKRPPGIQSVEYVLMCDPRDIPKPPS